MALLALLAAFAVPIYMSTLRGLTHVLTCRAEARSPFTLEIPEQGQPSVTSSLVLRRGESQALCGGLLLDVRVASRCSGAVDLLLPISNTTRFDWRGTVRLLLGSTSIPVDIGEIPAGQTVTDTVSVRVPPGSHEINGSLLLGP